MGICKIDKCGIIIFHINREKLNLETNNQPPKTNHQETIVETASYSVKLKHKF